MRHAISSMKARQEYSFLRNIFQQTTTSIRLLKKYLRINLLPGVGIGHELLIRFAHKYSRPRLGDKPRFAHLYTASVFRSLLRSKTAKPQCLRIRAKLFYAPGVGIEPTTNRLHLFFYC